MAKNRDSEIDGADTGGSSTLVTEQVKQGAQSAAQQAQETAGGLVVRARQQTTSVLQDQKTNATQTLGAVSQALRQTGESLDASDQAPIGQYAGRAADQIDRLSGYLDSRNIEDLVSETETFARRNPALFLGGAFAIGLLAARFLKSSSPNSDRQGTYGDSYSSLGGYGGNRYSSKQGGVGSGTYDYANPPSAIDDVATGAGFEPGVSGDSSVRSRHGA
ncbi:MAG: hypothetical protein NVS2B16_28780 [Chloroflexota bacterium]